MKPRTKRIVAISCGVVGIVIAVGLILNAFQKNLLFFFTPTQVMAGEAPQDYEFRVGGMVKLNSVTREENSLKTEFVLTDSKEEVTVQYTGILPDLFREGQGIIAKGQLDGKTFIAAEVLAKHDENYMPPEVADMMANQHSEFSE